MTRVGPPAAPGSRGARRDRTRVRPSALDTWSNDDHERRQAQERGPRAPRRDPARRGRGRRAHATSVRAGARGNAERDRHRPASQLDVRRAIRVGRRLEADRRRRARRAAIRSRCGVSRSAVAAGASIHSSIVASSDSSACLRRSWTARVSSRASPSARSSSVSMVSITTTMPSSWATAVPGRGVARISTSSAASSWPPSRTPRRAGTRPRWRGPRPSRRG